ncbi:MAG TPA: hypothetical protein VIC85_16905 [Ktedonobacterales bacterium]
MLNATTLVRLYPRHWRTRYGDELVDLLESRPLGPLDLLDVLLGALDAHLHTDIVPGRVLAMVSRLRSSAIAVFAAYIAFVIVGIGFQKMTEYDDFQELARAHPEVGIPYNVIVYGSGLALLAVLIGGLPLAYVALRDALARRRWGIAALFVVPALAFGALVGFVDLVRAIAPGNAAVERASQGLHLGLLVTILLIGAVASTVAISTAIARSEVGARVLQFAMVPTAAVTVIMAVMLVALVVWGLAVRADGPQLFNGNDGVVSSLTAANWIFNVGVWTIAVVVAVAGTLRGLGARGVPDVAGQTA